MDGKPKLRSGQLNALKYKNNNNDDNSVHLLTCLTTVKHGQLHPSTKNNRIIIKQYKAKGVPLHAKEALGRRGIAPTHSRLWHWMG
jgi:hypothetical protein